MEEQAEIPKKKILKTNKTIPHRNPLSQQRQRTAVDGLRFVLGGAFLAERLRRRRLNGGS